MASPQDAFSSACAKQVELAERCFELGMAAAQRLFAAQMEGSRQIFELQGRQFGALGNVVAEEPAARWPTLCRYAVAGGAEASEVCLRTVSALQAEGLRLMEAFVPMMNGTMMSSMARMTDALAGKAGPRA